MSEKYKVYDNGKAYFLTLTVVGWIDVFTRKSHKEELFESLRYCQKSKGLEVYGYCLMPSHVHLIAKATSEHYSLSDILRDFKKFTSKAIVQSIINEPESRREWMLAYFKKAGEHLKNVKGYKFWQDGNHAEMIETNAFFDQKLNYIHNNPVNDGIVERPEDYLWSSARNYSGLSNYLEIVKESVKIEGAEF
jgi:REP element-mobilizing transposase RayT